MRPVFSFFVGIDFVPVVLFTKFEEISVEITEFINWKRNAI